MTQEEAIKKLADIIFDAAKSGYMPYDTNDELCALNIARKYIDDFYTSLPSNIDEAAEKIAWDIAPMYPDISWDSCFEKIKEGIKAGAEWMAGQGYSQEEIVEDKSIEVGYGALPGVSPIINLPDSFKPGDKVIVQIRKKQ